jgi:PAS domain-containing protein
MARQPAADDPRDAERVDLRARVAALEVELRESEERFRSLFENAALGVVILDSQGYVVAANAVSCRLLGYAPGGACRQALPAACRSRRARASNRPLRRATARRAGFLRR